MEIRDALAGRSLHPDARPSAPFRQAWMRLSNFRSLDPILEINVYKRMRSPELCWQSGGLHHRIRSWEGAEAKRDYMMMNSVRAGLVARPEDWPFRGEIFQNDEWW
jgi:putative transposase